MERVERKWPSMKKGWQRPGPGRASLYKPEYAHMAEVHCRLGATNAELGDLFGVSESCIRGWIIKYPDFAAAAHRGLFDAFAPRVVRSLAQQAIGYAVDVEETKVLANGRVVKYTTRKQYPPNVTACIFWLKNRCASEWRDVRDCVVEHNSLDNLTSKQLLEEIKREAAEMGLTLSSPELSAQDKVEKRPTGRPAGGTKH